MPHAAGGGLRVIAGSARGLLLKRPRAEVTRPTAGRLREALFAMLEAAGTDFSAVLDLYAGSGALGIEALSRGDGTATFVEADARAAAVIRENLAHVRFTDRGRVVVSKVERWRATPGERYTLILADPPYDGAAPWGAIESAVTDVLAEHAVIVVEHDARTEPPEMLAGRVLWKDRRQGAGAVAIYRSAAREEDEDA